MSDRVMTVGIVMTVPNKFRLCAVLMFQIVITTLTVIALSLTLKLLKLKECMSSSLSIDLYRVAIKRLLNC